MQLEQLEGVWREVMSLEVFELTMGALVAHLLNEIAKLILEKLDIASDDAERLGSLLPPVLKKSRALMKVSWTKDAPFHSMHVEGWQRRGHP